MFSNHKTIAKAKSSNSPSWNYPLLSRLLSKRRLPSARAPVESEDEETVVEDAQVPDHRGIDPEETSVDSAGTGENSSFIKRPKKKKSKKRTSKSADDSDEEPARTPFSESHLANKQVQRLNNHPKMARSTRKSGKSGSSQVARRTSPRQESKRKAAALKNDDDYRSDDDEQTVDARAAEMEDLKRELAQLKAKNKVISAQQTTTLKEWNLKSMIKSGTATAEQRLVYITAKTDLWKVQKFIYLNKELIPATTVVMNMLDLKDLEGLEGTDLEVAQANWVQENAQIVRCAINDQRNYVVGECFKLIKKYHDANQEGRIPHKVTVKMLALRQGLPETEEEYNKNPDMQAAAAAFQWYWDELVPKVAGHSNWGPGKRHHGLLSFMKPHDSNVPYVTPSDEAFIVTIWENYMDSWYWKLEQARADKNFKLNLKNDDHVKATKTPFTLPQGGANKWGGWNKAGRQFYRETLREIINTKNTAEKIASVEAKEKEALRMIRIHHKVEEREAARKKPKNTEKEELDSDHEPEFAMYYP
jgi:hypothetical protein